MFFPRDAKLRIIAGLCMSLNEKNANKAQAGVK